MNCHFGVFGFLLLAATASASNILGLFLTHSPSHVIIHLAVVRALVERGHNVTVITSIPLNDPNPGYRHIFLKDMQIDKETVDSVINGAKNASLYQKISNWIFLFKYMLEKNSNLPNDPDFKIFLEEDNQFDLLLLGYAFNEFQLGVAAHFKCPTVLSWMIQPTGHVARIIGNPTFPAFVPPAPYMDTAPLTFSRRVLSFIINLADRSTTAVFQFYLESLYNKNYPPDKYPSLTEMKNNISLILFNHHFSEGPVRPLVPGLIEMGGIQIKDKPDPLPEDIDRFLENSPQGAIFFSLGSNAREDHLGANFSEIIYMAFSSLPYNVLWKFDSGKIPGNASNIVFKKWLPQDDILAHKNLKLFVTHAGKGSVTESEYHGVPMVAIPVFGDQSRNAEVVQTKGHGLVLDFRTLTQESLCKAIVEVMGNDSYRRSVVQFSRIYRDRPLTARQNVVFWIEYVIRHSGAPHMQSPLKTMNILQENSIDVILFLIVVSYITLKLIKILIKLSLVSVRSLIRVCKSKNKVD